MNHLDDLPLGDIWYTGNAPFPSEVSLCNLQKLRKLLTSDSSSLIPLLERLSYRVF